MKTKDTHRANIRGPEASLQRANINPAGGGTTRNVQCETEKTHSQFTLCSTLYACSCPHAVGARVAGALRYLLCISLLFGFFGCTSTDELTRLQQGVDALNLELNRYKAETDDKLSVLSKDTQTLGKQVINISASADDFRENRTKIMLGKLDELEHQLQIYWNETKAEINVLKKSGPKPQADAPIAPIPQPVDDAKHETSYREAFDAFQKGSYEEAVTKFSNFIATYSKTPLAPNAYFWLGESYMNLKNYDNAILNFQEVCDKYPKSDKVPRAMLSQAEVFGYLKDKKSSITIFKKVIELYPKSEEAIIADRKLRNLGP